MLPLLALVFLLSPASIEAEGVPTSAPTYEYHCKRSGECIDLGSSKFCCTGKCRYVGTSECGYRCLSADTDDFLASDDIAVCEYHTRNPTTQPTTFQPTTSECLRGGTCMTPNSTCCSGKCHNADKHCGYHYRCNDAADDDTGAIENNDYCLAHLKKVHNDDDDDNDTTIGLAILSSVACIVLFCIFGCIWQCCRKRPINEPAVVEDNFGYSPMVDSIPIATATIVSFDDSQPAHVILQAEDSQETGEKAEEFA